MNYGIKEGYVERPDPEYFVDECGVSVWQPDVYSWALARKPSARVIIDVGCGSGDKIRALLAAHPDKAYYGVDYGSNLVRWERRVGTEIPKRRAIDYDLDSSAPIDAMALPFLTPAFTSLTIAILADVIEHLRHPERILQQLSQVGVVVISTPDRDRTWGLDHAGPPPNRSHVREWNATELGEFLGRCLPDRGWVQTWTRSRSDSFDRNTILVAGFKEVKL